MNNTETTIHLTVGAVACKVMTVSLEEWHAMDSASLWSEDSQELDPNEDSQAV